MILFGREWSWTGADMENRAAGLKIGRADCDYTYMVYMAGLEVKNGDCRLGAFCLTDCIHIVRALSSALS